MAAEPDIREELCRLRARVPQLTGALVASADGHVLAQDTPGVAPETVAALTATALGVVARLSDATGQGEFRELLVRGVYGYAAAYPAGRGAVLTLLAQDRVNVGRLHLEGRRAGVRIGELVDAETAETAATTVPRAAPAQLPASSGPAAPPPPDKPPVVQPTGPPTGPTGPPAEPSTEPSSGRSAEPRPESAPRTPAKTPAKSAAARTRTPRAPRTTGNARTTTDS
ncbi:roadblock/LC7 domain-containing protein [Streptomyces sp. NPDC059378]|uniref:roadblock/LC7 domain-containing protein n=1 Tax=Streptomyces sp. NPDC059378 TaxID=3346815 RepID=UPI00368F0982